MPRKTFALSSLKDLDLGRLDEAFAAELQRVVADCQDRPFDNHPRVVEMQFEVVPVVDQGCSECDEVQLLCKIKSKVPVRHSKTYSMRVQHDLSLVFHTDYPDEPDAQGLFDGVEEGEEEDRKGEDESREGEEES